MGQQFRELWRELRERRVVGAAAAYAAAAFVLLQLAEILFPAFDLGPSALRVLLGVLVACFPVVLAFSWVYDVTLGGLRRTHTESNRPASSFPPVVLMAGVILSAGGLGLVGWRALGGAGGAGRAATESSIAVLPFADMSAERDQAYLGDGLAEEILNLLAGTGGLHVAARTSSFAFRDLDTDIREVAGQLGVATVLEGSVRKDGNRVRVTAQLIDAGTGFHLWSDTYDREVRDLFAVQDEIAGAIVSALLGTLELPDGTGSTRTVDPAAQEAYWRGRAQWNRRDAVALPGALRLFEQALTIDPEYAEAYAGLADAYALLPGVVPGADPASSLARAQAAARKAIELDSTMAEPHASLGLVRALDRDRLGALESLERALDLNPSYAPALHWRANVLAEMGRLDAALPDAERAARLDPLSPAIAADLGNLLLWLGRTDDAEQAYAAALALDSRFASALFGLAMVALQQEQRVELQMRLAQWAAVSGLPASFTGELATAMMDYRLTGAPADVPAELRAMGTREDLVPSGVLAALHALIGSRDGAIDWLRRSVEDRSWVDQYLAVNRIYDGLREDPAFLEVLLEVSRPAVE